MKRPTLRLVGRVAMVALLLAAGVLVLGPVRHALENRFERVKEQTVERLEDLLGRRVTYGSVSPSILRYLSIRDLTIHGTANEPAEILNVQQVRVYYRPLRLLRGEYSEAITEIRIENTVLTVDTRLNGNLTGLIADLMGNRGATSGASITELLPPDLVIGGRNIELSLRSEFGLAEIDRLFFTTSLSDQTVSIRSEGDVRLTETPDTFPLTNVTARVEATGTIDAATGDTLLELSLPALSSDLLDLQSQVLQVRFTGGVLEARNVQNQDPIDLYLRYIDESGELYARILADRYRLSDLVRLRGEYESVNQYLGFRFSGQASATITPQSLSYGGSLLTRIENVADVPDGDLTLRFDGTMAEMTIDELDFDTTSGRVSYEGRLALSPLRPTGRLALQDFTYGGIRPLTMSARVRSSQDTVSLSSDRFDYAGSRFNSLSGSVTLVDTPRATFVAEIGAAGGSRLEIETEHDPDGSLIAARIDARAVRPDRLVEIQRAVLPRLTVPDISLLPDELIVDTRVNLDLSDGLKVEVPLFYAYDFGNDDYISFSASYDNGSVGIVDLLASYRGYAGEGDFTAAVENGGRIRFTSDVVVEGVPYEFVGTYKPDNSLEISGLHDVEARLYFGERGQLVFRASGDIPIPVSADAQARLAFSGEGFYFSPDDWSVTMQQLTGSGIPFGPVPDSRIELVGDFGPSAARLRRIGYQDSFSTLSGTGEIDWNLTDLAGSVAIVLSDAAESGRSEQYEIRAAYADNAIEARASATALPLLRIGIETIRGTLDGSIGLSGSLDALSASAEVRLVDGKFNNDPIDLAATVELDPSALSVTNASARYARSRAENVSGSLSLGDGRLDLAGTLVQNGEAGSFAVGLAAGGFFAGLEDFADIAHADFAGAVTLSDLPVQGDFPPDWEFLVERRDGVGVARGGPSDAVLLTVEANGEFRALIGAPLPLHFEAVGLVEGGAIEADLIDVRADVARLWSILDTQGFALNGGVGTGSLRIVGPLNDPDFYGTLVAEGVTAAVDLLPDPIGPGRTFIVFDEKILTVRETSIPAGNGSALVSVEATLDRWLPEQFRVLINTEGGSGLRILSDFGGVAVDGVANGTVTIDGDRAITRISGDITASSTGITLSELPEESPATDEGGDIQVDMTIRSGRGVEFRWPSNTFPILRGFADVGENVRITYESGSSSFSVTGAIDIQGGEVFYFDRSFYIREGRITFDEDEQEFDPLLTVTAEIREVADEGPVEIYLVADERPLSEFTPRWRSDPPLSEASILALLGGNVFVGESGAPIDLSEAVLLTSDLVSQFGIIRGFESSVRDALQLDLFSVRTQLFQNLLRGVIDQNQEYPLDNAVPSLGQYLDNTTLFMGKYLGTDLFLELLVQLSSSEPTALEPRSLAGIEVESELSLEWQTPFFLLEWTFFPRDPSSLFLADNTISFSWEYSY